MSGELQFPCACDARDLNLRHSWTFSWKLMYHAKIRKSNLIWSFINYFLYTTKKIRIINHSGFCVTFKRSSSMSGPTTMKGGGKVGPLRRRKKFKLKIKGWPLSSGGGEELLLWLPLAILIQSRLRIKLRWLDLPTDCFSSGLDGPYRIQGISHRNP